MKNILLFGGSFDPIHNAHLFLAREAYNYLSVDKCYFLIAKNPRWKNPLTSCDHRLEMLKLALEDYQEFDISLIEYNSHKKKTYTYDTICSLKKEDEYNIYYLIGSDQLQLLDKWHNIDKLSKLVKFVIYKRYGYDIHQENLTKYNCLLLNSKDMDISSTKIRGLQQINSPLKVLEYIAKHRLYYFDILKPYFNEERLLHCISVASLSYKIALNNNVDVNKAYLAGLIHDIGKKVSETNVNQYLEIVNRINSKVGKWALHQFVGEQIARNNLSIEDEDILNSIKYHATGIDNMSKLQKIIYCADKLDPTRGWDSSLLIEKCISDIDKGFIEVLEDNIKYFKNNNISYHNYYTEKCLNFYLKMEEY